MIIIYVGYWISVCHYSGESNEKLSTELLILKLDHLNVYFSKEYVETKDMSFLIDSMTLPNQALINASKLEEELHVYNIDQKKILSLQKKIYLICTMVKMISGRNLMIFMNGLCPL